MAEQQTKALWELVRDVLARRAAGEDLPNHVVEEAHPHLMPHLRVLLERAAKIEDVRRASTVTISQPPKPSIADKPSLADLPRQFGSYRLLDLVSVGGMGTVYRAVQDGTDRVVALKMIRDQQLSDELAIHRFETEAKAASKLEHPNIVTVYEIGTEAGYHYISMQYVDGIALDEEIAVGPLDERFAAEVVAEIAEALQYAHEQGVIHRDIKPSNILLDAERSPHLVDFGLARELDCDTRVTRSGSLIGSPSYMAPEQASGSSSETGPKADVYSLGAVLYEMLVQRPPFVAATIPMTLLQVINEAPLRPVKLNPFVSRDLETICLKCLEKSPARRYRNPKALADDLRRWLDGKPIAARPTPVWEQLFRWAKRERKLATALFVASCLLIGLVTALGWGNYKTNTLLSREAQARADADTSRANAEKSLYISHMNLAQSALESGNIGYMTSLLEMYRNPVGTDPRGFEWHYLFRRSHFAHQLLKKVDDTLLTVACSPEQNLIAFAGDPEGIFVYRIAPFEEVAALKAHSDSVAAVRFSDSGNLMVSAGHDSAVRVWNTETWESIISLPGHPEARSHYACFTADETHLVSTGGDGTIRVWSLETARQIRVLGEHDGDVHAAAFSPDERLLVSGGRDGEVHVWDFESGDLVEKMRIECEAVRDVAFSTDGRKLLAATSEGAVVVFDTSTYQELATLVGHQTPVAAICCSPDGRQWASAGEAGRLCIWDAESHELVATLVGHQDRIYGVAYADSGNQVYTVGRDGTLRLWQTNQEFDEVLDGHSWTIWEMDFTKDGKFLVSAGADNKMVIWNAHDGRPLRKLEGHENEVNSVRCSPNGQYVLSGSDDYSVRLWDLPSGKPLRVLAGHKKHVTEVDIHPDGMLGLSCAQDGTLRKWELATGELIETFVWEEGLTGMEISPDGSQVVACDREGRILFLDFQGLHLEDVIPGHSDQAAVVTFSPDGSLVASGGRDSKLLIWDVSQREVIREIEKADVASVESLSFSPNGRSIASGGGDCVVKLWDLETGQVLSQYREHEKRLYSVVFSPDGNMLVSGDRDGKVVVRRIDPHTGSR